LSKRSHIVIDALQVHQHPTGVALASLEYLAELAKQDRGFQFTVLASQRESFEFLANADSWQVVNCCEGGANVVRKGLFTQWGLPRLLGKLKADLLHSLQFVTPLRAPCPVVATVHDMAWRLHRETIEQPRRSYYRFLVPRCMQNAEAIVTNSRATAQDIVRCLPGLSSRVSTTPFGAPTWLSPYQASEPKMREEKNAPYFLFVGTLEPRKNLVNLLAAFAKFLTMEGNDRRDPKKLPRLILAGGPGWQMTELDAAIRDFPYPQHLIRLGYQENEKLASLYAGALALVFPSLYEGFGLPILEAMSMSVPVLTSDRGAMAEVAGEAAVLVDPLDLGQIAQVMQKLTHDRQWRDSWAEKGLQRSREWSWRRTVAKTLPIYEQLTS